MHFFEETYFDILVNLTKSQLTIPIKNCTVPEQCVCLISSYHA